MQYTLLNPETTFSSKWYIFKKTTELGKIYETIAWTELEQLLPPKTSPKGAPAWLKPQGYFGMMFLKHYTGLSDEKLLDLFHSCSSMQLFCGILLEEHQQIKNNAFVSHIRSYLSKHLDIKDFQKVMNSYWKKSGDLENTHLLMMDATCFESYIRYPTDVKLLWECCEKIHEKFIPSFCRENKLKLPRTVFKDKRKHYLAYSKNRKKGHRKTLRIRKKLLNFLEKSIQLFKELQSLVIGYELNIKTKNTFSVLETVLKQQKELIEDPTKSVENRIVSIFKPYVRPIKRGKENKPVEFGMKVHMCQTDGINWIEHLSFSAFNECNRLTTSVLAHEEVMGKCTHLAADNIYPTNANRKFITENGIKTNFPKKGRKETDFAKAKAEKKERNELGKKRSTVLEGSFGNEKNNYMLRKIKALKAETELIWVLFGVYTANVVLISKKRERKKKEEQDKKAEKFNRIKAA